MTCNSSELLFESYFDNTLTPAKRARLLRHVNGCGSCTGIFEELRVVDALLASPRAVELPENFTFATMAEVRTLPQPHLSHAPVFAYLVSYLVAAWLLIGAGFLLAGPAMRAVGSTAFGLSESLLRTLAAIGGGGVRALGDFGSLGTFVGGAIVLDIAVALAVIVGFTVVRPRVLERLRG